LIPQERAASILYWKIREESQVLCRIKTLNGFSFIRIRPPLQGGSVNTESIVNTGVSSGSDPFPLRTPRSVLCDQLSGSD